MSRAAGRRLAALLAAAVLLPACVADDGGGPAGRPDGDRPLVLVSGADLTGPDGQGVRQELIDQWNAEHPETPVELVELPPAEDGQRSELIASLQSGSADYDVINLDTTWVPEFAEAGLIEPLDGGLAYLARADFLPQALAAGEWEGKRYAVPFNTDVGLLYYDPELLAEQNQAESDVLGADSLAALLENWPTGYQPPAYTTQLRPYEGLTVNVLEALWSAGIGLVSGDGRYQEPDEELLARALGFFERAQPTGEQISPVSYEADETAALGAFTSGASVMMRGWPYAYASLPAGYAVTTLPGQAALGGQSLAISATSARERDAAALIEFLTHETGSQRSLLDAGFAPALRTAYGLPEEPSCEEGAAQRRPAPDGERPPPVSAQPEYVELLWCALRDAHPRPRTPYYTQFSQTLQRIVARMLADDAYGAAEAARDLNEALPRALEGRLPEPDHGE
ncbi:extracellular solute-binding protein [Streptomyces sp. 7-21]|uniref:extracellular solute-binding protein n=1 Tax=Streptomyces sp. 7-21 TaxID=2802283 RepID=UPI00191F2698|nr:extracellular solute-binding protein [Streptomyces sp. 7-21]MBL1065890.1 extracellular solute-binding protein [Streptomyces sp. 7-21]